MTTSTSCEEWRDIPGYEGSYQASTQGHIRSLARTIDRKHNTPFKLRERILKPRLSHKGYLLCGLSTEGRTKNLSVHRLVALVFLPNPYGKPEINHKNGNKQDNRVENLEWVTSRENVKHSIEQLGNRRDIARHRVRCIETGKVYASGKEAAREIGCRYQGITAVCRGEKRTHHGLHWEYVEEEASK